MEINGGGGRGRVSREMNSERSKASSSDSQKEREKSLAAAAIRAQVVYYLSRNGQLEHPHFFEISHLPNQFLRLKDVIQRLSVLRGRGMTSLFSWSCKRSYKNGYVWNDLSENDIIYPADDAEYVLKGSEIIHGCNLPNSEQFQHLQLNNKKTMAPLHITRHVLEAEEEEQDDEEEMKKDASGNSTASDHITYTQCTPPSYSEKPPVESVVGSFRSVPVHLTRNSVLLHFISCGSVAVKGGRGPTRFTSAGAPATIKGRKSGESVEREAVELQCMSENPRRVGNLLLQEKEYFSGSIVEAMAETERVSPEPAMKKSSSYKEERGGKLGMEEEEKECEGEGRVRAKCIPGMKRSSAKQK